ncbi:AN1-type zinc finger protein 6 [Conger conger]|uniref:AN1-type zinc finger protein 6 n=1 Tax=Conger conger TaxID=82655 RepID=UPI002A59D030|nr:AN1-type zinc finger protein 6 [Conger conger]XP_061102400.1 AN1-type zinc finger protein 6 [Conger conger]
MAQQTNQTQAPLLCVTGCGFYGNPGTNGMCSVCYKDFLQRQNNNGRVTPAVSSSFSSRGTSLASQRSETSLAEVLPAIPRATTPLEQSSVASSQKILTQASRTHSEEDDSTGDKVGLKKEELQVSVSEHSERAPVGGPDQSPEKPKPKKNRCFMCRKKVGLTGFDCRCGSVFCGIHRYSDVHSCSFDYRADAAEKIRKENPVVVGEKIQKI